MKLFSIHILLAFSVLFADWQNDTKVQLDDVAIEKRSFDNDQLEEYRQDRNFQYEYIQREPSVLEKIWNWFVRGLNRVLSWIFGNEQAGSIIVFLLKIIPYVLLGVLLFFILKFFVKINTKQLVSGETKKASMKISDDVNELTEKDIERLLAAAIEDRDYRLAVRYYYLGILKELTQKNIINWHQEKTNEDYIKEIEKSALKEKFKASTYLYDFVWYGNFNINEQDFNKARDNFKDLKQSIL